MNQPIFILGVPYSGIHEVSKLLSTHKDIHLIINGAKIDRLRNNFGSASSGLILVHLVKKYMKEHKSKHLCLNMPWMERHPMNFLLSYPKAKYIIMRRDEENTLEEWKEDRNLKTLEKSLFYLQEHYANKFITKLGKKQCLVVDYKDLMKDTEKTGNKIKRFLHVKKGMDLSVLTEDNYWKKLKVEN